MTRFEEKGCKLQSECETIEQAKRTMRYSCRLCVTRGLHLKCNRCAIATAHEQALAVLEDDDEVKASNLIRVRPRRVFQTEFVSVSRGGHVTHVWRCD